MRMPHSPSSHTRMENLLVESLILLEHRFEAFDLDRAGTISLSELLQGLSVTGMIFNKEEIKEIFQTVDVKCTGALGFAEIVIRTSFESLAAMMTRYDFDSNGRLSRNELDRLFDREFPSYVASGIFAQVLQDLFQEQAPTKELSLRSLLMVFYAAFSRVPEYALDGRYLPRRDRSHGAAANVLVQGLQALEEDFQRLDGNQDGLLHFEELAAGLSRTGTSSARVDLVNRLQRAFHDADKDKDRCLDFFEYTGLAFLMSKDGAYSNFVSIGFDKAAVKKFFLTTIEALNRNGLQDRQRLSCAEVRLLCQELFEGILPTGFDSTFSEVAGGHAELELFKIFKILYSVVRVDGPFSPRRYSPGTHVVAIQTISRHTAQHTAHAPRIDPVVVSKFRPIKVLGEGGQCAAGKTFKSAPDEHLVREVLSEIDFFKKLDHPHCHYLLGAKTSLDNGGILVLTEVCEKGSLFDLYYTNHVAIDLPTAWRFARECGSGFKHIHNLGYMVADFGMCSSRTFCQDVAGTPQWMAPEVAAFMLNPRSSPYGNACDIYSYAILLWEIFHVSIPYMETGLSQADIATRVATSSGGFRPRLNAAVCPPEVIKLMQNCWSNRFESQTKLLQPATSLHNFAIAARPGASLLSHTDV